MAKLIFFRMKALWLLIIFGLNKLAGREGSFGSLPLALRLSKGLSTSTALVGVQHPLGDGAHELDGGPGLDVCDLG